MNDIIQTQQINDMSLPEIEMESDSFEEDQTQIWGRLFPLGKGFDSAELKKDLFTFGRRPDCDMVLTKNSRHVNVNAYSNLHFTIKRELTSKNEYYTIIQDSSSNGTFVNGEKIGKGKFQVINNNDEISLAKPENRAYIFIDKNAKEDAKWPIEITSRYTILKQLGQGAYGEVRLAFAKQSLDKYAIKIISKKKFTIGSKNQAVLNAQIMSEVEILKKLQHPCIIKIFEVIETTDIVFIVLELVEGGELFDKVVEIGQYDEKTAKLLFFQMVLAIKYLHDQGISHRDLKPENILLSSNESKETLIKITDFGLSKFFDATTVMKTFCGTPNYLAPEILLTKGAGTYTNKVDNWSLGVILYICLVGYQPFNEENTKLSLEQQITKGHYDFPAHFWSDISKDAIDLIKKLLTVDANARYTLDQVLEHPWIKDDTPIKQAAYKLMYPDNENYYNDMQHLKISNGSNGERNGFVYTNEDTSSGDALINNSLTRKRNMRDDMSDDFYAEDEFRKKKLKEYNSNSTDKSNN